MKHRAYLLLTIALPLAASSDIPSSAIAQRIPAPNQEEYERTLQALFLPIFTQGSSDDLTALLDQKIHPNNATSVKFMPKVWETLVERIRTDSTAALPIVHALLAYSLRSLPPVKAMHNHKKLILHMDVNGTVIFRDTTGNRQPNQSVLLALCDALKDRWDQSITKPMSFYDYVNHTVPGSDAQEDVRKKRDQLRFGILNFLRDTSNPAAQKAEETYKAMMAQLERQKSSVTQAFYKLVAFLDKQKIDYSIMLRSFGANAPEIQAEIHTTQGPNFFTCQGDFRGMQRLIDALPKRERLSYLKAVYDSITSAGNGSIRDDRAYWDDNGQRQEFGKPFLIDPSDKSTTQMFFDDNIKTDPTSETNIVNPIDVTTGKPLKVSDLIQSGHIVSVDGVQALLDDEYFIKSVNALLEKQ